MHARILVQRCVLRQQHLLEEEEEGLNALSLHSSGLHAARMQRRARNQLRFRSVESSFITARESLPAQNPLKLCSSLHYRVIVRSTIIKLHTKLQLNRALFLALVAFCLCNLNRAPRTFC